MIEIKDKSQCCGCQACSQICPSQAIKIVVDKEGFKYPKVIEESCVHCNLCEKVCPFHSNYVGESAEPKVYAAINKDVETCKKSSSGGVFTVISDWVLKQQGTVYGVEFNPNFKVVHSVARCAEERDRFRGSKYVQSDTKQIYQQVEHDLKEGNMVLFTGTPCQVEALNCYLEVKKVERSNLYTIDNICHGVASPKLWGEYVELLKKQLEKDEKIEYISMRSKQNGWRKQEMVVKTNQRELSPFVNRGFSWNRLFLSLYLTRPSCFSCKFTSFKRPGDLTLADYWNFENAGIDMDDTNGVSIVLVNSEKGEKLFEQVRECLNITESDKKRCWQIHLEFPNNAPSNRSKFWKEYHKLGTEKTLKKYAKGSLMNRFIRIVSPVLRKLGLYTWVAKVHHIISKR